LKKPFSLNPVEKPVVIQPSRKSRLYATQLKKPFSYNPVEKAVPIQFIEEAVPMQFS
jgi:hypothetical protein